MYLQTWTALSCCKNVMADMPMLKSWACPMTGLATHRPPSRCHITNTTSPAPRMLTVDTDTITLQSTLTQTSHFHPQYIFNLALGPSAELCAVLPLLSALPISNTRRTPTLIPTTHHCKVTRRPRRAAANGRAKRWGHKNNSKPLWQYF